LREITYPSATFHILDVRQHLKNIEKARMILDDLEYITIENQTTEFPKHFHETFCISLIHKGIEPIDFENQSLFSEAGSISITNPYEIHSNPLFDKKTQLIFDTIYIPNQLIKNIRLLDLIEKSVLICNVAKYKIWHLRKMIKAKYLYLA